MTSNDRSSPRPPAGRNWFTEALRIRPGELPVVLVLFAWCFCVVGAFFVGRAVRDTLFLARLSADKLPYVYIASPLVVTAVGYFYARIADRIRRDRLVAGTSLAFGLSLIATRFGLATGDWILYALYVGVQVIGALAMMQFWTVASDRYTSSDAKRLFGVIAAGGTVADIVLGAVVSAAGGSAGAENLLFLCGGLLLAAAGLALLLRRLAGGRLETARSRPAPTSKARSTGRLPKGARHLPWTAALIVLSIMGVTLVDFQFKTILVAEYGSSTGEMVRFFGYLSIATGIVSLLVQLLVTGRILGRFGIAGALVLLPLFLAGGQAALLVVPGLIAATFLKASEETFRYTVNDAAMQLTYMPVPKQLRGRFKALLGMVLKPGAQLVVGLGLLAYGRWSSALLPTLVAGLVVSGLWLAGVFALRRAYIRSVRDTLRSLSSSDRELGALSSEETRVIRRILADPDAPLPDLRTAVDVASRTPELTAAMAPLTVHSDPRVRAISLACSSADGHAAVEEMAKDLSPEIRAAAAAGLRAAGPDASPELIAALLHDPDVLVQAAALSAAEACASEALVGPLLAHLQEAPTLAIPALAACARGHEAAIAEALESTGTGEHRERERRRGLLIALGRIASPEAARLLSEAVDRDGALAATALADAVQRNPSIALDRQALARACDRQLSTAYRALAAAEGLGRAESKLADDGTYAPPPFLRHVADGSAALMSKALRERTAGARDCVLGLVSALYPELDIRTAAANLREPDPSRRAHAVELLEHALDRHLRARLVPLVDDSPRYDKLKAVSAIFPIPPHSAAEWIDELLLDANPWMLACAIYFAGMHGMVKSRQRIRELSSHDDPVVREAALAALARLADPDELEGVARALASDPFAPLRQRAREILASQGARP